MNVLKMVESMRNDNGHYARTSAMLQACGGFRYNTRKWCENSRILKFHNDSDYFFLFSD